MIVTTKTSIFNTPQGDKSLKEHNTAYNV